MKSQALMVYEALTPGEKYTAEGITLAAWRQHPDTFGLKGFVHEYPDHRKIVAILSGKGGMVQRGHLIDVGLTSDLGARQRLYSRGKEPTPWHNGKPGKPSQALVLIRQLFTTSAVRKSTDGASYTALDAMEFFSCSLRSELQGQKPWEMASRLRQIDAEDGVCREDRQTVLRVAEALLANFCKQPKE
jgi:hypothetical protein